MAKNNSGVINFGDLDTNVESRLGFKPDENVNGGICMGEIVSVKLTEHDIPKQDETGTPSAWEFAGLKTISLDIEYKQANNITTDKSERFVVQRETIVSAGTKDGGKLEMSSWADMTMNQFKRLQHIANTLDNGKLSPLSKKLGAIDYKYEDTPEVRISKMKKIFEHFYTQITGLPVKPKEGEEVGKPRFEKVAMWIKVVRDGRNGTYYVIPAFIGKGFLEVMKKGEPTYLELAASESIELLKNTKGTKGTEAKPNLNYNDADAAKTSNAPQSAADVLKGLNIKK